MAVLIPTLCATLSDLEYRLSKRTVHKSSDPEDLGRITVRYFAWRVVNGQLAEVDGEVVKTDREAQPVEHVGAALLCVNGRPEGVLYSFAQPTGLGESIDWEKVASALLTRVGRATHADALARFLTAAVGPFPAGGAAGPSGSQSDESASGAAASLPSDPVEARLRLRRWEASVFDISTGLLLGDIRDFLPVTLIGNPEALALSSRVNVSLEFEALDPAEAEAERDTLLANFHVSRVTPPDVRVSDNVMTCEYAISLADIFRFRALANPNDAEWYFPFDLVTDNIIRTWRGEDDYSRHVQKHLEEREAAWRQPSELVPSGVRSRRMNRSRRTGRSPIYGGGSFPRSASIAGYKPATIKWLFRARIDEVDGVADERGPAIRRWVDDDERDEATGLPRSQILLTEAEAAISPYRFALRRQPTVELLAALVDLGLAEYGTTPRTIDWEPMRSGRALAGTSTARYRRSSVADTLDAVVRRAQEINADAQSLYSNGRKARGFSPGMDSPPAADRLGAMDGFR